MRSVFVGFFLSVVCALGASAPSVRAEPPAPTGDIRVFGNRKIRTYVIRREIRLHRGQPFDSEKVAEARRALRRIPGVDYSEIRVAYTPADSSLGLSVIVTEKSTFEGFPVIQRGQEDRMSFGMRVVEHNLRGRSERLTLELLLRGNEVARLGWENPWLGTGPRIGVGLRAWFLGYDYVYDDLGPQIDGADLQRYGGEASVFLTLGRSLRTRLYTALGLETVHSDVEGLTADEDGSDRYLTTRIGLRHDGRDSRRYPWAGFFARVEGRHHGLWPDAPSIWEADVDARVYQSVLDRTVIAAGVTGVLRGGDPAPPYRREHLGGSSSLRGYEFGTFNGSRAVAASVEYRVPVNFSRVEPVEYVLLGLSFHAFADAGAAWEEGQDLGGDLFHGTFGVGLLLVNAAVPGLRIDYGWHRKSNGRWEIDIGAKF